MGTLRGDSQNDPASLEGRSRDLNSGQRLHRPLHLSVYADLVAGRHCLPETTPLRPFAILGYLFLHSMNFFSCFLLCQPISAAYFNTLS